MISAEYRKLNRQCHEDGEWGTTGNRYAETVVGLAKAYGCENILDYGAGKRTMERAINAISDIPTYSYDPCVKEIDSSPKPRDFVSCTDVLEHIEPEFIEAVLDDLRRVTRKAGFYVVSTVPAIKILPDGRNAHLIVEEPEWWLKKLLERFKIDSYQRNKSEFAVIVR